MDPAFLEICEDVKKLLRYVWQTENAFTIPVSGGQNRLGQISSVQFSCPNSCPITLIIASVLFLFYSGTGSAAWEAAVANLTQPGDGKFQ